MDQVVTEEMEVRVYLAILQDHLLHMRAVVAVLLMLVRQQV